MRRFALPVSLAVLLGVVAFAGGPKAKGGIAAMQREGRNGVASWFNVSNTSQVTAPTDGQALTYSSSTGGLAWGTVSGAVSGTSGQWSVDASGDLVPVTDNADDVGDATYRPRTVRAATSVLAPIFKGVDVTGGDSASTTYLTGGNSVNGNASDLYLRAGQASGAGTDGSLFLAGGGADSHWQLEADGDLVSIAGNERIVIDGGATSGLAVAAVTSTGVTPTSATTSVIGGGIVLDNGSTGTVGLDCTADGRLRVTDGAGGASTCLIVGGAAIGGSGGLVQARDASGDLWGGFIGASMVSKDQLWSLDSSAGLSMDSANYMRWANAANAAQGGTYDVGMGRSAAGISQITSGAAPSTTAIGALAARTVYEAHTSGDTLTASESGSVHSNAGAAAVITLRLPDAMTANGATFTITRVAAFQVRIDCGDTDNFVGPGIGAVADGKLVTLDSAGASITCVYDVTNTAWVIVNAEGTIGAADGT